jgi:hypothetical protein
MAAKTRTYDEWFTILGRELSVDVKDNEGRRRCEQDGVLKQPLTRQQAERYFAWNSFVRRREETSTGS